VKAATSNRASRAAVRSILLALAATTLATPVDAQPATRAEQNRATRDTKARQLSPPTRSKVESALFKLEDNLILERVLNPPRGVHLRLGGLGEGAGFGVGPAYRYNTSLFDARVSAAASLKQYAVAGASVRFPGTIGEDAFTWADGPYLELYARRRDSPQEDFYGPGPDSVEAGRTDFALRDTFARITAGVRRGHLTAGVSAGYLDPSIGAGTDESVPSTAELYGPAEAPGLLFQPAFSVIEPFVELATLDRARNDLAGGRYRVTFTRLSDRDFDRFSFSRWDVDLRQYLPILHGTRTIALRVWMSAADPFEGHQVPFYLQPTLGGAYSLRGFRSFRFRDQSVLLVQAEYRWRVNEFVSGVIFYDTGAVASTLGDIRRLERDYGFGLRAGSRTTVAFRAEVAFGGREGARFLLRFDDAF
jgi:hypothetical protein